MKTESMQWRHWLLLGRLIEGWRTGDLCDLHDLEAAGYAFKDSEGWHSTTLGMSAHADKLATRPSWEA